MNYIYDIVLNFQNNYYQFFEWNRTDKIKNISKLIIYHIKDEDLLSLTYNQVIITEPFLSKLKEDNKKYKKIIFLVSNTNQTIGLMFSKDGHLLKRSSLLFEEENEANNYAKKLPITKINYLENNPLPNLNQLRIETEKKDILIKYINDTKDILSLKYLYYEYFNQECENPQKIKKDLLKVMETEWSPKKNKLYELITLLTNQKSILS